MLLPTAADLVHAFVKDLANVFDQSVSGVGDPVGTWLLLVHSTTISWEAPRDYHIRAVVGVDTAGQWVLSYDGRSRTVLLTSPRVEFGTVIAWYCPNTVDTGARNPMNVFLKKGQIIRMTTTAAAPTGVMVYLTET